MVESEEHANIVKASQEVLSARKSFFDQQNSIEELTAELKDSKNEIVQLNGLIGQKNASVEELKAKNDDLTLKVKGYESAVTENEQPTFIDKILDYLNRKFG
jgi:septal ring factor EnvC (AmiA/AmiB activator)